MRTKLSYTVKDMVLLMFLAIEWQAILVRYHLLKGTLMQISKSQYMFVLI